MLLPAVFVDGADRWNSRRGTDLFSDTVMVLAGRLGSVGSVFLWGVIVARFLGPERQGVISVVIAFGSFLALASSGGAGEAALFHAARKRIPASAVAGFVLGAAALSGVASILAGFAVFFADFPFFEGVPGWGIFAAAAAAPFILLAEHVMVLMVGVGKARLFAAVALTRGFVMLLAALALPLLSGARLAGGIAAWIAGGAVAALLAGTLLLKWSGRPSLPGRDRLKQMVRYGLPGAGSRILGFLVLRADIFLVNYFLGAAATGVYAVAVLTAEVLRHVPSASGLSLFSRVAAEGGRRLTLRTLRFNFLLTAAAAAVMAFAALPGLRFLFGEAYAGAAVPFRWLLLGMPAHAASSILANHFLGEGAPARNLFAAAVVLALNLGLNLALIPVLGIAGAAMASAAAYWTGAVLMVTLFAVTGAPVKNTGEGGL